VKKSVRTSAGDLADELGRYLYRRVGAVILEDLPGQERRLRLVIDGKAPGARQLG
jgi:hypothetical protein